MSEEIKVSASDRSLIKIIDDANYSGYGNAVTAEIERLQTKLSALQKENAELRDRLVKEHLPSEYKSWEQAWQHRIEIQNEVNSLRTQNRQLRSAIEEVMSHRREDKDSNYVLWIGEGTFLKCEQALALQPEK